MGRKLENLSGMVFNGITVLDVAIKETGRSTKWNCICHCGEKFVTTAERLKSGKTKSCGCERYHYKFIEDRYTYNSYNAMIDRCTNKDSPNYPKYGGSGVSVCCRWLEKGDLGFLNFVEDMGSRPQNTTLNRIHSADVYSKETCEWASLAMQSYDQKLRKDNLSGICGVKYRKDRGKWIAYIRVNGEHISLYYGNSKEEAIRKRKEAEMLYYDRAKVKPYEGGY